MSWFHGNVTGELGNSRSGQESVLLAQGQKHNISSSEGLSFYERPDSESCCSGSGVQKHSHLCCCYETRIKVAKSHHQRHLPLHRLRRAAGKAGWRMEVPSMPKLRLTLTWAHIDVQHLHWEQPSPKALFSLGSKPADSLSPFADGSVPNLKALCCAPFPTKAAAVFTCQPKSHSQDLSQPTPLPQLLLCNYSDDFSHF